MGPGVGIDGTSRSSGSVRSSMAFMGDRRTLVGEMTLGEGFPQASDAASRSPLCNCGWQVGLQMSRLRAYKPARARWRSGGTGPAEIGNRLHTSSGTGIITGWLPSKLRCRQRGERSGVVPRGADWRWYVSLSLLAVPACPAAWGRDSSESNLWLTVLITAVALLLAHQVAFRLSSRLGQQRPAGPCRMASAGRRRQGVIRHRRSVAAHIAFGDAGVMVSRR